jgi:hypothetical protein
MTASKKGFRYVYTKEKADEYRKFSTEQRLEWLEMMSRFLSQAMPQASKDFAEKLRRGEI